MKEEKEEENKSFEDIRNEINLRLGFKVLLSNIILNICVLTFWDEWGSSERFEIFYFGNSNGVWIEFSNESLYFGLINFIIYWVFWGSKKPND